MGLINMIYNIYKNLFNYGNFPTGAGKRLHEVAISCLGLDMTVYEKELGCAETINNVVFKTFGDYAGGNLSTYRMYHSIKNNRKFIEVKQSLPGDIVLSPTGHGNGKIKNGHVGIVSFGGKILSNDSKTGRFMPNYDFKSWNKRYKVKGGFPVLFYRRISY